MNKTMMIFYLAGMPVAFLLTAIKIWLPIDRKLLPMHILLTSAISLFSWIAVAGILYNWKKLSISNEIDANKA